MAGVPKRKCWECGVRPRPSAHAWYCDTCRDKRKHESEAEASARYRASRVVLGPDQVELVKRGLYDIHYALADLEWSLDPDEANDPARPDPASAYSYLAKTVDEVLERFRDGLPNDFDYTGGYDD
ncbi:MAG: hypothetical protein NVSMB55_00570 [Mycobacteriales bacterium]